LVDSLFFLTFAGITEDGIYNLLEDVRALKARMAEILHAEDPTKNLSSGELSEQTMA
jgi:hypothetical protein